MNVFTDKCDNCGNLNKNGALHCDRCGKGLSANLTAKYKKYTWISLICFALCVVSVIASVVLKSVVGNILPVSLLIVFALILLFCGIKFIMKRNAYKYSDNIELTLTGTPEESAAARLPAHLGACPSCGHKYRKKKAKICKYCGYDFKNQSGVSGKSRLSDEDLIKTINNHSNRAKTFILSSLPFVIAAIIAFNITGEEFSVYSFIGIVFVTTFMILFAKGIFSMGMASEVYKVNVVRDALAGLIDDCVYRSNLSISEQRIKETGLFDGWNKFRGNDYIRGMYHGHQFEFSDINLEEEHTTGSGDNSQTVTYTIFKGQWVTCRLGKKLPSVIRLREDAGKGNAETENIAFNNKYAIFTDDPHYMFYVLTPHFMEYIVAADEAAKARTYFYFSGDTVHIAIDNGCDGFEIPSNKAARNDLSIAREHIKNELKYITDILDMLMQNESLFLKS